MERGLPRGARATGTRCTASRPRPGWGDALPEFEAGEDVATRDAGKTVMQALKPFTPTMVGGAADLVESTKTEFEGGGVFSATHAGRNIAFGIREHGMGSIVNGLALHGGIVKPYGSTFFVFSDYMRPAVRLSALMALPGRLGLDARLDRRSARTGPTHQPVEHYAALRAIPNLWFVRPRRRERDRRYAWKVALDREDGPVALVAHAPEGADARPHRARARVGRRAGRLRPLGARRRPT